MNNNTPGLEDDIQYFSRTFGTREIMLVFFPLFVLIFVSFSLYGIAKYYQDGWSSGSITPEENQINTISNMNKAIFGMLCAILFILIVWAFFLGKIFDGPYKWSFVSWYTISLICIVISTAFYGQAEFDDNIKQNTYEDNRIISMAFMGGLFALILFMFIVSVLDARTEKKIIQSPVQV